MTAAASSLLIHATTGPTPMPGWLTFLLSAATLAAAVYLLYVILRPERF